MSEQRVFVEQVADQCAAVAHMAKSIAGVYSDYAEAFRTGHLDKCAPQVGKRTAELMERLGDILNGMDAVTEEDDWITPVLEEAQRLWPDVAKDMSKTGNPDPADGPTTPQKPEQIKGSE